MSAVTRGFGPWFMHEEVDPEASPDGLEDGVVVRKDGHNEDSGDPSLTDQFPIVEP